MRRDVPVWIVLNHRDFFYIKEIRVVSMTGGMSIKDALCWLLRRERERVLHGKRADKGVIFLQACIDSTSCKCYQMGRKKRVLKNVGKGVTLSNVVSKARVKIEKRSRGKDISVGLAFFP